jgi:hypothetical protein
MASPATWEGHAGSSSSTWSRLVAAVGAAIAAGAQSAARAPKAATSGWRWLS